MRYRVVPILLGLACISVQGLAQDLPQNPPAPFFSREKWSALGVQLAAQVRRKTTLLELPDASAYIEKLGEQLAAQMPEPVEEWHFSIINEHQNGATFEPISLPGGWVFVPAQLFLAANNQDELAGMLAHAMAHVAQDQVPRRTPGDVGSLATIPTIFFAAGPGLGGDDPNALMPAAYLKTHRENELAADRGAVAAMLGAGFDPTALLNYVARLQRESPEPPSRLSPLPPFSVRIANLQEAIQDLPVRNLRALDESFRKIQAEISNEESKKEVYPIPSLIHPSKNQ